MTKSWHKHVRDTGFYAGWASNQLEFMLSQVVAVTERERFIKDYLFTLKPEIAAYLTAHADHLFTNPIVGQLVTQVTSKEASRG